METKKISTESFLTFRELRPLVSYKRVSHKKNTWTPYEQYFFWSSLFEKCNEDWSRPKYTTSLPYSVSKEASYKPLKVAAAKKSFSSVFIIDITLKTQKLYGGMFLLVLVITCLRGKFGINLPKSLFKNFEISRVNEGISKFQTMNEVNFSQISRINMWFLVKYMWQALKEHTRVRIT